MSYSLLGLSLVLFSFSFTWVQGGVEPNEVDVGSKLQGEVRKDIVYELKEVLGSGAEAITYLAWAYRGGAKVNTVAVKVSRKRDGKAVDIEPERNFLRDYHSKNRGIVRLYDEIGWAVEYNFGRAIVLELLNYTIHGLSEKQAIDAELGYHILCQLIRTLKFVHESGFAHYDLNCDNIMVRVAKGEVVIIDFGHVREVEVGVKHVIVGEGEHARKLNISPHIHDLLSIGTTLMPYLLNVGAQEHSIRACKATCEGILKKDETSIQAKFMLRYFNALEAVKDMGIDGAYEELLKKIK